MINGVNGRNGKHKVKADHFMLTDDMTNKLGPCLHIDCKEWNVYARNDHCLNSKPMQCKDGHPYLVWYSPEKDTYMVSSN